MDAGASKVKKGDSAVECCSCMRSANDLSYFENSEHQFEGLLPSSRWELHEAALLGLFFNSGSLNKFISERNEQKVRSMQRWERAERRKGAACGQGFTTPSY